MRRIPQPPAHALYSALTIGERMAIPAKLLILMLGSGLYLVFHLELKPLAGSIYLLPEAPSKDYGSVFEQTWVSSEETNEAHSASIALLDNGQPVVVWYGGTEEGHTDVSLFLSTFNKTWSTPIIIADRLTTEVGLSRYIRKVGNPTLYVWPDGNLGVFYVSVSVGGWGGSAINYIESSDNGNSWSRTKRLVTSPFLNISTLVRANPVERQDGNIELPIYHEFAGKFAESLVISRKIQVIDKRRISWGKSSLQPAIAPLDGNKAVALLRYAGEPPGRIWSATSNNTGENWTQSELIELPNPNSAIALLNTGDGNLLLALNDVEDGRNRLSLAIRPIEANRWQMIKTVEEEINTPEFEFEFSYPSLLMDSDQNIHMVYTWNQKRIRHTKFNLTWLNKS